MDVWYEKCGQVDYIVIDSDKPSIKTLKIIFRYKRINHFNEC